MIVAWVIECVCAMVLWGAFHQLRKIKRCSRDEP